MLLAVTGQTLTVRLAIALTEMTTEATAILGPMRPRGVLLRQIVGRVPPGCQPSERALMPAASVTNAPCAANVVTFTYATPVKAGVTHWDSASKTGVTHWDSTEWAKTGVTHWDSTEWAKAPVAA